MSALLLLAAVAWSAECGEPCGADAHCARLQAECLVQAGESRQAVKVLKAAAAQHPGSADLVQRMALAYLDHDNTVWATRRLLERVESHPEEVETRAWAVWMLASEGDVKGARQLLPQDLQLTAGPEHARLGLAAAMALHLAEDADGAEQILTDLYREPVTLYPEDRVALRSLGGQVLGAPAWPVSARLWLTTGGSTNATETSPQAEGGEGSATTVLSTLDLVARYEPWHSPSLRPRVEGRVKLQAPFSALDYAYADASARLGMELGDARASRVRLLYSAELLGVNSGDLYATTDQRLFMEAHRGEVEAELPGRVQVFGGGGRRVYRTTDRTRTEVDGGVAAVHGWSSGISLTGILTARWQDARHEDWDLYGATALARVATPLPAGAMLKARVMGMRDVYPHHTQERRDWSLKAQVGPWTPSLRGWRLGLTYGFNDRWSQGTWTVDPWSYSSPDHRVLLEARWEGGGDPFGPTTHSGETATHVALPWGLSTQGDAGLDRVQDLLRQEDSARRGSSCVD